MDFSPGPPFNERVAHPKEEAIMKAEPKGPADLIVHHAKIVTVDAKFSIAEAIAVKDGRVLALGDDESIFKLSGPKTRIIDADGQTVLPGLYDSHMHPLMAATSELTRPLPNFHSLKDVFAHIKERAAKTPEGNWIILRFVFPTRLEEARFPTKAELDEAAPKHPVLFQAGPAGMVNSVALKASSITKDTPNPPGGVIVKDAKGEPTGMLRNAYRALKGVSEYYSEPKSAGDAKREAVRKLLAMYNAQGLTSIGDRDAGRDSLDIYLSLKEKNELTIRVNVSRSFTPDGTREEVARRLDELPGKDRRGGPTGVGDDMVRIGPIKLYMDGGMLNGTAYMRQPWPKGDTYQITEEDYRGLLFLKPEPLLAVVEEAAQRKWKVTAHTAGEAAMDALLDAYETVDRATPIKDRRFCITHANFPSQANLERCKRLGVCADVQPAWLFKDGTTLLKVLGEKRMHWFSPYKTWLQYTTIGGGSDHMIKLDSLEATNPWNPWLGMWITLARVTERGTLLTADERLTREQALRLYTINNAYLNHEEKVKGSLEVGKLGDLIIIDRDFLTCPLREVPDTRVLYTIVGGKVVYERKA
jgi:predicted amidohydrolase YtcJ